MYTLRSISFNIHGRQANTTEEKAFAPEHRGRRPPATKMSPDFSWRDWESRMIMRSDKSPPGQGEGVIHPCGGFARDGARASKPEWPNLVPIFYGHHDLSTLLLGTVPTKRSELVDTVKPTSS
jgi:hypothetical protein